MNEDSTTTITTGTRERIASMVATMAGDNPFDKIVEIRDVAQAMIGEARDAEEAKLRAEGEELAAKLSATRTRLGNLDKVTKAHKPRAARKPRAAKVPTTTAATKTKVKATGTGTVSSAA